MPKKRSEYHAAVGKLISAVQKEWANEVGTSTSEFTQAVISAGHLLLNAKDLEQARELLGGRTVQQFLGDVWVRKHPLVKDYIDRVQLIL